MFGTLRNENKRSIVSIETLQWAQSKKQIAMVEISVIELVF